LRSTPELLIKYLEECVVGTRCSVFRKTALELSKKRGRRDLKSPTALGG
jgi:hypothetical protein